MSRLHVSGPSIFQPGGLSYFKVPHKYRKVIKGAALEVLAALDAFCMKQTVLVISDAVIARFLDRPIRYVQRGLKRLEKHALIWRFTEWAEGVKCRTIFILEALLESDDQRRKRERAEKLATKKFGPGMVKNDHTFGSTLSIAPSFEGEQCKDQQTPPVGESDGTDPPGGLGSGDPSAGALPPDLPAEAILAAMMSAAAEVTPPPAAPEPARTPTAAPVASVARIPAAEALERAKPGLAAVEELRRRALAAKQTDESETPRPAEPHDVEPAPKAPDVPAEPPRSDPPRASPVVFGRWLVTWLRRLLE